jgi:proteasome lid subunit RPN8/RPN11
MPLLIPGTEIETIRRHLERVYPEEGCGILTGVEQPGARRVERAHPAENRETGPRAHGYRIAAEDFLAAEKRAREEGLDIVGFYHSHPDHPPVPSGVDLERAWPWYAYLIASVTRGTMADLQAWERVEGPARFERVPLVVEPAAGRPPRDASDHAGGRP